MAKNARRWAELSPVARLAIVKLVVLDAGLKAWALTDLARRPAGQVRGSKAGWGVALALVNSVGLLPAAYFAWGRRSD